MDRSRLRVLGVACALAGAAVLVAGSSRADATVSLTEASISRQQPFRSQALNPLWISRADCLADDVITFPLYVTNFSGLGLEVWVGGSSNDCKDVAARAATTGTCWQVYSGAASSNTVDVQIRARDIVGQHKPSSATGTPSGPGSGTLEDCSPNLATTAPVQIALYFMFIDPSDQSQKGGTLWKTAYDLLGPNAPGSISVGQGDTMLKLSWSQSTDTDLVGYQFFCDPIPGQEGSNSNVSTFEGGTQQEPEAAAPEPVEASTCDPDADDASCPVDDGGSVSDSAAAEDAPRVSSGCPTVKLYPGDTADPSMMCGSVTGLTTTEGRVEKLTNKYKYSLAVAGYDAVGNVGKLSNVVCAEPWPVDDFFKLYRRAGGEAGGSFCSVGSVGQGAGMATLGMLGLAALARTLRRRRKAS